MFKSNSLKSKLFILIFFIKFSFAFTQEKNLVEHFINDVIEQNKEYLSMKLNPLSFIPELNNDLKNDENYKYTMKEVKDKNFSKYFEKVKFTKQLNWKTYRISNFKVDSKNYTIQISTPIFINKNREALIQVKTDYCDWINVYKLKKNNKWEYSYGFGNKKLPKNN